MCRQMLRKETDLLQFWSSEIDFGSIARALQFCRRIKASRLGKSIHSCLVKGGFRTDVYVANNLIAMYVDFRSLQDARQVFDEMPMKNVVSWASMISGFTQCGNAFEAMRLFTQMHKLESESVKANNFVFSSMFKACAIVRDLEMGRFIYAQICIDQLQSDIVLMNSILDMYVKCGSLVDARRVFDKISRKNQTSWNTMIAGYSMEGKMVEAIRLFDQMPEPDIVSWNTMIAGFARKEDPETLEYLYKMHKNCIKFNEFTFPCAIKICGCLKSVAYGKLIHCYVIKSGHKKACFVGSSLIDMYAKCGRLDAALNLFTIYSNNGDLFDDKLALWNAMISGYAVNGHNEASFHLVSRAHSSGLALDSYTFSSILKVCSNILNLRLGRQIHGLVFTKGYHLDSIIGTILVDLYAKCGNIMDALGLFQRLPEKDMIAWGGLISGCVKKGSSLLVFTLFKDMLCLNLEVDHFIISSTLKACSSSASVEGGKQVHACSVKLGCESEGITVTSLIDMYLKCGSIDDALTVFEGLAERDTVCWTGIIVGCGQHGRAKEGLRFFQDMLKSGVSPNEITFLGVLSACRHAGLVEEACRLFGSMRMEHKLIPGLEHYCCIVDLLGRAGYFEEAMKLIREMPYKPDKMIWGSLLGACVIHGNVELGKHAVEKLSSIIPRNASVYVALSNIYASLGMWEDSTKLREVIREVSIKDAGRSWIEVKS